MKRKDFLKMASIGSLGLILGGCADGFSVSPQNAVDKVDSLLYHTVDAQPPLRYVACYNQSGGALQLSDYFAQIENLNTQLRRDFLPIWGALLGITTAICYDGNSVSPPTTSPDCSLYVVSSLPTRIGVGVNEAGGFHNGFNSAYITTQYGLISTLVGMSHELLEMLANFYALETECCDLVEANAYPVTPGGPECLSDFSTPAGLGIGQPAPPPALPWDFLGVQPGPNLPAPAPTTLNGVIICSDKLQIERQSS
jgi:hypothetical protein